MIKPRLILTDIEGTTTSIAFVHDVLFPYFLENIHLLNDQLDSQTTVTAFEQTKQLAKKEGIIIETTKEILTRIELWAREDRKITPLKSLQGVLWKQGYENGTIKGHVYRDVAPSLEKWKSEDIELAVFSSGSIAAQRLLFGYSEAGDLTPFFSHNFDTITGGKKESETYKTIAKNVLLKPKEILFLSDIVAELQAADQAGMQTIQLVREGTIAAWKTTAKSFSEIQFDVSTTSR